MPTVRVNRINVAFDDYGVGRDTLLLVHGHPFNRSMWSPQLDAAANAGWRAIAPDLRGYGQSTVVPGITRLETFAADCAALLDTLGVAQAVIAGLSMGGQIAMEFARQYPHRVRGLLIAATFPQPETIDGKAQRNAMADRLLVEGMHRYAEEALPRMLAARTISSLPTVARTVLSMMRASNREGAAAALRGRAERSAYETTLARLTVPALVVVGSEDAFTTRQDADNMHRLLGSSELLWLEGIGHMPNLEDPASFNAAMVRLLKRVVLAESSSRPAVP